MATNLHALIRYMVLDKCFRNRLIVFQWQDLAQACAEEFERQGKYVKTPARRTIMQDINHMRSGHLGYEAPIAYSKELGYHYTSDSFSIHNQPLHKKHIEDLVQGVLIIHSFAKDLHIQPLIESMQKILSVYNHDIEHLEPKIYLEHSYNKDGHIHLKDLYEYTIKKQALGIRYQPFDKEESFHVFHPYFLKIYNGRWYVFGFEEALQKIINLSLDRIISIVPSLKTYKTAEISEILTQYQHVYGVTLIEDKVPVKIRFICTHELSKYMRTKPIHSSQKEVKSDTFELFLVPNYEIKHKLLSFGAAIEVISPKSFVLDIKQEIFAMYDKYTLNSH